VRYADGDLRFLAQAIADGDDRQAGRLLRAWHEEPALIAGHLEDERVLRRLMVDRGLLVELSPRFLFSVLLRRIRLDMTDTPYTVERIDAGGRVVVFDAGRSRDLLESVEMLEYLVELLVSFERAETMLVRSAGPGRARRRLSTLSIDDMLELAALVDPGLRPMIFRRIGDIALFTTGLFPDAVVRGRRSPLGAASEGAARRRFAIEDYEAEGRRFYRLAAERFEGAQPGLARVLARLSDEFTAARKPLTLLAERYVAWARPHWTQVPS
jgi:hypothetical protein